MSLSELVNPHTDLPFDQTRLLLELRSWSTTPSVIQVVLQEGLMTPPQLKVLSLRVAATLGGAAQQLARPLTFRDTAIFVCRFLDSDYSRRQIAKCLIRRGVPRREALPSLRQLRLDLYSQFALVDELELPKVTEVEEESAKFAPDPEEAKKVREAIDNSRSKGLHSVAVSH